MLDLQRIRDFPDTVKQAVANKKSPADIDGVLGLDAKRREIIKEVEQLKNRRNTASEKIAGLKKEKKDAAALVEEMKGVSEKIKELDAEQKVVEEQTRELLIRIPNVPHATTPHGQSEKDNVVAETWGQPRTFDFEPKDHLQIGTALDLFDFPRGAKIAGAGFPVYKGDGALLERALINFFLDTHTRKNGYLEIFPPFLANYDSLFGTGQLPKSREQMYYISEDQLFCIPTAEVPVTNMHRDEELDPAALPVKYCAYSACFRREAGSYG